MKDVWDKFRNKITTTGLSVKSPTKNTKLFPCVTICTIDGFKRGGVFYSSKEYEEKTYDLVDIFGEETLLHINNASLYYTKEVRTPNAGVNSQ